MYLKAKWSSLRALGCPVLQLYFGIRPFAKLSPAMSLTKGSLNPPSWRTTSCITTQLTHLVSGALAGVVPIGRLPVVTPQTSSNRTCHCCICGGQTSGCSSSLDELPCDEGCTVKWQWFPSSLTCIASLGSVGSLCLPLDRKMLSLVTEETLPFGVLNVYIHFCLWHPGNKAFIFHSEEQIVPLECWRANKI